ncbi:MAG TPA: hypothetical protein VN643_26980 [Pyrinomonadaceae bacterium]|nr:hypothetical protein [Pyrinomonadaceae bacterium]
MPKINSTRFFIGGLVASILAFLSDGFLHEQLVKADWAAVYSRISATPGEHSPVALFYFAVFDLGRGFVSMFLYVMMRRSFGPGPKTAVLAGLVSWLAICVTTPAQFIPLGFYSNALWWKAGAFQLVTSIIVTVVGAALYKDELSTAPAV